MTECHETFVHEIFAIFVLLHQNSFAYTVQYRCVFADLLYCAKIVTDKLSEINEI